MGLLADESYSSVVIAGAGGFGTEVFDYLQADALNGNGPPVVGFLDDTPGSPLDIDIRHLGRIDDYRPIPGQAVIVAVGSVPGRKSVLQRLWTNGAATPAFAAANAQISTSARIGRAVVICPFSMVNHGAALGDAVVINVHCSVGHAASVGEFSVLSPYAALNGGAAVGRECFLGTRSTIYPKVRIGDGCVVDSHTGVRAEAGNRQMISSRGNYLTSPLRTQ